MLKGYFYGRFFQNKQGVMEFWWGKEQLFPKILTTPKMEFLHSRKAKAFFGVGQSLPGSNSSGIEKFSKFPECDFPTGTNKQGPLAGFSFWESISIILDYRYLFLDISAPIRIS